jgi:dTDP-4-amino-4,6-dideoxygalactose transaminase
MVVVFPSVRQHQAVSSALADASIGSSVHFTPLHRLSWFAKNAAIGPSGVAEAESLAGRVLSLPLHPGVSDEDIDLVCGCVAAAIRR